MTNAPETPTTLEQFAQFAQEFALIGNTETALTWGYEIESNTMANVHAQAESEDTYSVTSSVSWQADGSVNDESDYANSEECNCDCSYCSHDCDCEHCDPDNYELEHDCGSGDCYGSPSDYQEVASIGGLTDTHPEGLDLLAKWGLNQATFNTDCGIHIHIGSAHLTAPQVANVMTAYRLALPVLNKIAERSGVHYAQDHTAEMENEVRAGTARGHKYQTVNVSNHMAGLSHQNQNYGYNPVQTIEFRQMGATSHTSLNQTDRVRAWAFVLRALVAYATRPAPALYWIGRAKDFDALMRLLRTA